MPARTFNMTAFKAKLIAPLPASEEQADTPEFCRAIRSQMMRVWLRGLEATRYFEACHLILVRDEHGDMVQISEASLAACKRVREAQLKLCLIPAPTMAEVRWKLRLAKHWRGFHGGRKDEVAVIERAIVADLVRLDGSAE